MNRGLIGSDDYDSIKNVLTLYGLPCNIGGLQTEDILQVTRSDKKMESGKIKFILLNAIGDAYVDKTVTDKEMLMALKEIEG